DPSCPSLEEGGVLYTANPCAAMAGPGDQHRHLLRIRNAGTEPAIRATLIDRLPASGDEGVLGGARGTTWDQRPTLATAPQVTGRGVATVAYDPDEPLCTLDLSPSSGGCAPGEWLSEAEIGDLAEARSIQVNVDLSGDPLPP